MNAHPSHRSFLDPKPDLDGKVILVTGGAGSFGKAFCSEVLENHKPSKLIVFSRDEGKHHDMQTDPQFANHPAMRWFIGDVRDLDRLLMAMRDVDLVVHAAALKQVPTAEYNPFETIRTNVFGAENVVTAAIRCGVPKVIALSTDKAANPINLYGASKLASDKIFVSANNLSGQGGTQFAVVRYGNVMGSRGSVIPLFRRMIEAKSDHLPITDARMTRFWITLRQGVNFVLSCSVLMGGGEIFVPKIPSARMPDLATAMAPDLPIKYIGVRAGEKLHEVMITQDDARETVEIADRYIILPPLNEHLRANWQDRGAASVDEAFSYSSDSNREQLSCDDLTQLLQGAAV